MGLPQRLFRRWNLQTERSRTAVAGIASAVAIQAGLVVSGVVLARALGPTDRGDFALVTLLPFIFTQIGMLGIPLSVTYAVAKAGRLLNPVSRIAWRACAAQGALLTALCAAVLFAVVWDRGSDTRVAAAISLAVIPVQLVSVYSLAILQGARRVRAYYVLRTLMTVGWVAGLGICLAVSDLTVISASISYTFAIAVTAIAATITVRHQVPATEPNAEDWVPTRWWMTSFGLRGLFGALPIVNAYRLDQAVVGLFLGPATLGAYVVATSFTNLPRFIGVSIGAMTYPNVARQKGGTEAMRIIWRYLLISIAASATFVLPCLIFTEGLVTGLFGEAFASATGLARVLLLGSLLVAAQRVLIEGARGLDRPGLASLSELALLVTLVGLSAILLPIAGVTGVAWGMLVAAAAGCGVAFAGVIKGGQPKPDPLSSGPETVGLDAHGYATGSPTETQV